MDGGSANVGIPWEQFARYFSRGGLESNFSAMCRSTAFGKFDLRRECRHCGGLGSRVLAFDRATWFYERIADETRDEERNHLRQRMAREAFCRPCGGQGSISQRPRGKAVKADGVATTVTCPRCRGKCKSRHGGTLHGSSCGEVFPPTDASAEMGDVCQKCLGDAYVVPITVRPNQRTQDHPDEEPEDEEPRGANFDDEDDAGPVDQIGKIVEALRDVDEDMALGLQLLSGEHGEKWAAHDWGRGFSLWPMNDAGQRLADEATAQTLEIEPFARQLDLIRLERESYLAGDRNERRQALIFQSDGAARRFERRIEDAIWKAWEAA